MGLNDGQAISPIYAKVSYERGQQGKFMSPRLKRILFGLFLLSGFCGLLYQIVWLRMGLSSFGVITPVVSGVLSVFMLGLFLGTWLGGRWVSRFVRATGFSGILLYGLAEIIIGAGAFILPELFTFGRTLLLNLEDMNSLGYLLMSLGVILVSMLPWCIAMGATFPFMLAFVKEKDPADFSGFSFLYFANTLGAMLGVFLTSFVLIELLGFTSCLRIAGTLNFILAACCYFIDKESGRAGAPSHRGEGAAAVRTPPGQGDPEKSILLLLFLTGFGSMSLEVIWMRAFTPVLGTMVYAFAGLLTVYLLATWMGARLYRSVARNGCAHLPLREGTLLIAITSLLPVVLGDPDLAIMLKYFFNLDSRQWTAIPLVLVSIFPLCFSLGYITPMLIDRYSAGDPERAGFSYAVNIIGSILGPLGAAYLFLPVMSARVSMISMTVPFILFFLVFLQREQASKKSWAAAGSGILLLLLLLTLFKSQSYEEGVLHTNPVIRRDHTATVISSGEGIAKILEVNGAGMTRFTPITKVMAHFPLATLKHKPESALVIAFGMGTTYRSMLSWNIETTAVELVPSVVEAFSYYFGDAEARRIFSHPMGRIVIDDGKRYLARTDKMFDLITIDPPPPVQAAGSSLLYSEQFYQLARRHLKPKGILLQWFPRKDHDILQAVIRSARNSFPYLRVFIADEGAGFHIFCSQVPIEIPSAETFVSRMPPSAQKDLLEWTVPNTNLVKLIDHKILSSEVSLDKLMSIGHHATITDDRPYNEYFFLRWFFK
ncbi:hypothetical protein UR09_00405 [Candidatus Nitromaritima sp. SCGC AAA799-A02]|nr:hypothetical protein UR09_00405 [Candidatus Nitromaritima sp. SCGC AAA799-A02]